MVEDIQFDPENREPDQRHVEALAENFRTSGCDAALHPVIGTVKTAVDLELLKKGQCKLFTLRVSFISV